MVLWRSEALLGTQTWEEYDRVDKRIGLEGKQGDINWEELSLNKISVQKVIQRKT